MTDDFKYEVFLNHHSKDKPVFRALANACKPAA